MKNSDSDNLLFQNLKSNLSWKFCYLLDWKPFKNEGKYFLFRLKSFFRSFYLKFCHNILVMQEKQLH